MPPDRSTPDRSSLGSGSEILLFGGTFDPVHQGHIQLGFAARDLAVPGGRLVFVPAAISPHKNIRPTPGHDRAQMIRLACEAHSGHEGGDWSVWTEELDRAERDRGGGARGRASYWVDTLEVAATAGAELSFLIGADQAVAFNRWHRWGRILELARPVVILRDPFHNTDQLNRAMGDAGWSAEELESFFLVAYILDLPLVQVNATSIRRRLREGSEDHIEGLDPAVQRYVIESGLYSEPDLSQGSS